MLPQERRISKTLFTRHTRGGVRVHGTYFSATITSSTRDAQTRCAVVVSGKVSKKAVIRNKIRRRAYEVVAQHISKWKEGYLVVFYARPEAKHASFKEILNDIERLVKNTKMLLI